MKKQILKYSVFAWLCLTVILNGCKKDEEKKEETPVVDPTPTLAFLKVGNQHKYDVYRTNLPADTGHTTLTEAMIWNVDSVTNGVFKVRITFNPAIQPPDSMYFKKDKEGIWIKDSVSASTFNKVVKSNPAVGDSLTHFEKSGSKTDTTFSKVIAVGVSVKAGTGTYNCVKIKEWTGKANKDLNYDFTYIDLSVGLIKTESYMIYPDKPYLALSYQLKVKNY